MTAALSRRGVLVVLAFVGSALGRLAQEAQTTVNLPSASLALKKRVQEVGHPVLSRGSIAYQELLPLGERLAPAVPEIAVLLDDEREEVRTWALSLAFALDWEAEPLLPQLLAALGEADPVVQANAAAALGNLRSHARMAVGRLEERVTNGAGESASWSAWALGRIDPTRALRDARPQVRIAALRALNEPGAGFDPGLVPLLLERLTDEDPEVRASSALVLGNACAGLASDERRRIGSAAFAAFENETRQDVREWLLYTLGRAPECAADTVPVIVEWARADPDAYAAVVMALGDLGGAAKPAFDFLVEAAGSADEGVRHDAMHVLAKLDSGNPATVSALRLELERHALRSTHFRAGLEGRRASGGSGGARNVRDERGSAHSPAGDQRPGGDG